MLHLTSIGCRDSVCRCFCLSIPRNYEALFSAQHKFCRACLRRVVQRHSSENLISAPLTNGQAFHRLCQLADVPPKNATITGHWHALRSTFGLQPSQVIYRIPTLFFELGSTIAKRLIRRCHRGYQAWLIGLILIWSLQHFKEACWKHNADGTTDVRASWSCRYRVSENNNHSKMRSTSQHCQTLILFLYKLQ